METMQAWEEALLLMFNGTPGFLGPIAWWLTQPWLSLPVYLLVIAWCFRGLPWRRGALRLAVVLATFGATDAVSSRLFKPGFERLRPSHEPGLRDRLTLHIMEDGTPYRGGRFGFVSSHAANTFGLAAISVLLFGAARRRWLWIWAAIVSWTRLYLGVHYTGDIVCGAALGIGLAAAVHTMSCRLIPALNTP